ncbi:MAG TPA: DUF2914 domain-containing protein [Vicinamibacterales bacterium]|jgi:hypothetical protein
MREARSIIEEAEEAAASGHYVSAETLLREAARMQEKSLGPLHPDLANTLNNLAVVCEITGRLNDAEQGFRRACLIATTVLEEGHPFVATSRKNLHDFCEAHGKPIELPTPPPKVTEPPAPPPKKVAVGAPPKIDTPPKKVDVETPTAQPDAAVEPPAIPPKAAVEARLLKLAVEEPQSKAKIELPEPPKVTNTPEAKATSSSEPPRISPPPVDPARKAQVQEAAPAAPPAVGPRSLGRLAMGAIGPVAVLILILLIGRPWVTSSQPADSASPARNEPARTVPVPPAAPVSAASIPVPVDAKPAPIKPTPTKPGPKETTPAASSARNGLETVAAGTTARASGSVVVKALLCGALADWRCDPLNLPVPRGSGSVFFYTLVKSPVATTIQHRWYQGDRLHHSVDFRIQASPNFGYRSYSRGMMDDKSAGDWKVELRAEDGTLLYEERFSVN